MILKPSSENLARAAQILKQGGVVAFPTETVYGLGADATNELAVQKIFKLKNRPSYNPLIVHIADVSLLGSVADLEKDARATIRAQKLSQFWPGPLSLVLPKKQNIAAVVTAGLDTLAVRVPAHETAHALLLESRLPLAAPSANLFTTISPTTAQHVEDAFDGKLEMVLDGGACRVGVESTIVSLVGEEVRLLRPGGITLEQIQQALGPEDKVVRHKALVETEGQALMSPGMLRVHYAPKTPLLFKDSIGDMPLPGKVGLIAFSKAGSADIEHKMAKVVHLSSSADLAQVAARLFAALRDFDRLGLDLILIDTCHEEGLGMAIMDRLKRATAGFVKKE